MSEDVLVVSTQIGSFRLIEPPRPITAHRKDGVHRFAMLKFCFKPVAEVVVRTGQAGTSLMPKAKEAIEHEIGKNGNVEERWLLNDGHIDHHGSAELRVKVSLSGITDETYSQYIAGVLEKLTQQLESRFGLTVNDSTASKTRRREHQQTYVNRTTQVALR